MRTYLYRLTFEGPVHFGTTGIGLEETEERVRSDSLTSALINAFSVLGRAEHVVETLTRELPAFTLSSLFPYGPRDGGKVPVYALPRPIAAPPTIRDWLVGLTKKELAERTPQLTQVIDNAVQEVLDQHMRDLAVLDRADLAQALQPAFERTAGPVLDEFARGVEASIKKARVSLAELLQKRDRGTLTRLEEIELRFVQLWKTYWNVRMRELE